MDGVRLSQLSMIAIRKGAVVIALEEWLGRADGSAGMSAEQYVAAYGPELVRDGWQIFVRRSDGLPGAA
jgi:hypothetical protein